jgi:hypothetical protein
LDQSGHLLVVSPLVGEEEAEEGLQHKGGRTTRGAHV